MCKGKLLVCTLTPAQQQEMMHMCIRNLLVCTLALAQQRDPLLFCFCLHHRRYKVADPCPMYPSRHQSRWGGIGQVRTRL